MIAVESPEGGIEGHRWTDSGTGKHMLTDSGDIARPSSAADVRMRTTIEAFKFGFRRCGCGAEDDFRFPTKPKFFGESSILERGF